MAVTEEKPKNKVLYHGKEVDIDKLENTVISDYDNYARQFGYSRSKYEKDLQGLQEIMFQIRNSGATIDPYQITFTSQFGNEKGLFGKNRNKSRHYTNPTWMIIKTLQKMENGDGKSSSSTKSEKKLNETTIKQELQRELTRAGNLTNENNRKKAQLEAINAILGKYFNGTIPEGYTKDDNFDLDAYKNKLVDLQNAINSDNLNDDELAYYYLDMTNPVQQTQTKEPENGLAAFLAAAREAQIPYTDAQLTALYNKYVLPNKTNEFFASWGINIKNNNSSNNSGGGSRSKRSSGSGVQSRSSQPTQTKKKTTSGKTNSQLIEEMKVPIGGIVKIGGRQYENVGNGRVVLLKPEQYKRDNVYNLDEHRHGGKFQNIVQLKKYAQGNNITYIPKFQNANDTLDIDKIKRSSSTTKTNTNTKTNENTTNNNSDTIDINKIQRSGGGGGNQPASSDLEKSPTAWARHVANISNIVGGLGWFLAGRRLRPFRTALTVGGPTVGAIGNVIDKNYGDAIANGLNAALGIGLNMPRYSKPYMDQYKNKYLQYSQKYNPIKDAENMGVKGTTYFSDKIAANKELQEYYKAVKDTERNPFLPGAGLLGIGNGIYYYGYKNLPLPDYITGDNTGSTYINGTVPAMTLGPLIGPYTSPLFRGLTGDFNLRIPKPDSGKFLKLKGPKGKKTATVTEGENVAAAAGDAAITTATAGGAAVKNSAIVLPGLLAGALGYSANTNANTQNFYPPYLPGMSPTEENEMYNLYAEASGLPLKNTQPRGYEIGTPVTLWDDPFRKIGNVGNGHIIRYDDNQMPVVQLDNGTERTIGAYNLERMEGIPVISEGFAKGNARELIDKYGAYPGENGEGLIIPDEVAELAMNDPELYSKILNTKGNVRFANSGDYANTIDKNTGLIRKNYVGSIKTNTLDDGKHDGFDRWMRGWNAVLHGYKTPTKEHSIYPLIPPAAVALNVLSNPVVGTGLGIYALGDAALHPVRTWEQLKGIGNSVKNEWDLLTK